MTISSIEAARDRRRKKERDSEPADLEIYIRLDPNDTRRVDSLWTWCSYASGLNADSWQGAERVGALIHCSWWTWMNWDAKDFEDAWRTEPVFSVVSTRHGWVLKTSTEFAEEAASEGLLYRARNVRWLVRQWGSITWAYLKYAMSILKGSVEP